MAMNYEAMSALWDRVIQIDTKSRFGVELNQQNAALAGLPNAEQWEAEASINKEAFHDPFKFAPVLTINPPVMSMTPREGRGDGAAEAVATETAGLCGSSTISLFRPQWVMSSP